MPEWWEHAYPGAPMVKLPGFPRPLYPPDASQHGKKPSVDGPDVVAYKRTVSRAGRYPWAAFDDAYSNGFAHGKSGNVGETGVAGVQRQQGIDDSGWLGKKTFNALRSIVIPVGLQHAGTMAMDAIAVDLLEEAWSQFLGSEPPPAQGGSIRGASLNRARGEVGTTESPANSNRQKYGAWYGMDAVPWCAIFVSWCRVLGAEDVGTIETAFARGSRYSYVPYIVGDAQAGRNGLKITTDPVPGDLVCYDFGWNGEYDHVGIFEAWQGSGSFSAIEGNTSPGSSGSQDNGGGVYWRERSRSSQGTVFVRADS